MTTAVHNDDRIFPFKINDEAKADSSSREVPIKWRSGNTQYEIHTHVLDSIELKDLVPHCLQYKAKIGAVGVAAAQLGPTLFREFGRTLSIVLQPTWDQVRVDFPPPDTTEASFDATLRHFIAAHATADDRHEAVQQLRNARKPRKMGTQAFWYALREQNGYIQWLPGAEAQLNDDSFRQAYYDAMPETWKERFVSAGYSVANRTMAQIARYMRSQESMALKKQHENTQAQRARSTTTARRGTTSNRPKRGRDASPPKGKDGTKESKDKKTRRIENTDPCPLPGHHHKWGACRANAYNDERLAQRKSGKAKDSSSSKGKEVNMVQAEVKEKAAKPAPSTPEKVVAINDDEFSFSKTGTFYPKECYATFLTDETHYLDSMSYQTTPPMESNEIMDAFSAFCEAAYVQGDYEANLLVDTLDVTTKMSLRAIGLMQARVVQGIANKQTYKVLFDTGSDATLINDQSLPKNAKPRTLPSIQKMRTISGVTPMNKFVMLEDLSLPEFSPSQRIPGPVWAIVFEGSNTQYDLIIGMDLMQALGIDISCSTKNISWMGQTIPFRPRDYFESPLLYEDLQSIMENDPLDSYYGDTTGYHSREILPSKYETISPFEVAARQTHLTKLQQSDLATLLGKFPKLFSNELKTYPHRKIHIDLKPGSVPVASRPYPVPKHHEAVFKQELQRLCDIGVLEKTGAAEWLSPTFVIPKKDNRVRWISDMRALNKCIKRKVYNLPRIQDILRKRPGYQFLTKIDLSMHYYTFELDDESKDLCSICTPFGNYRYRKLVMGLSFSPDIAQEIMEDLFRDIEEVDCYIDDVGVFDNDWKTHLRTLDRVLQRLQDNNFVCNPLKCDWCVKETDWLGYWLTPTGLRPWKKKIAPILGLRRPRTPKELRSFIGAVTFYRDMFPHRSHILAPLTAQSGRKKTIDWTDECQKAFDQIKAMLASDAFTRYPDHNKPFHIYCDASDKQLGAVIMQDGAPVAYYSRKLNKAQRNYTVGEKEMLSIVETLKEYHTMLYGSPDIHVYTDHRNNTFSTLSNQRVMRWRMFIEDYNPTFHYVKGEDNPMADALSRLHIDSVDTEPTVKTNDEELDQMDPLNAFYSMAIDDDDLFDCFVHLPEAEGIPFQLDYPTIAAAQAGDALLQQRLQDQPQQYARQLLAPNVQVICRMENNAPWKICLPDASLDNAVRWYHLALSHLGSRRLYDTISTHFYHPHLRARVDDIVERCDTCQRFKQNPRGYGELAPREAEANPWRTVAVDLVGPWKLQVGGVEQTFMALTIIDTVTNLVELVRLDNKTSAHVSMQFENNWLSRYPLPVNCIYDQGKEFIGWPFQYVLQRHGIHAQPTSVKNPQANAICERMHQAVGNALRVFTSVHPPQNIASANQLVDMALANAMYATRASVHGALQTSPGAAVFGRDMILDIPLVADFHALQERRQLLIDQRLIAANRKRFSYDYRIGDQVMKLTYKPDKLQPRAEGPYRIETVHQNGTLTLRLNPHTLERLSVRRVKPYRS
jgi:transposase InsO family protein